MTFAEGGAYEGLNNLVYSLNAWESAKLNGTPVSQIYFAAAASSMGLNSSLVLLTQSFNFDCFFIKEDSG